MANCNIPLAKVTELVKCPICLDYYSDPRLLPCSHTFCFACITQLASHNRAHADDDDDSDGSDNEEREFVCPLKDGTSISQHRLSTLPVNRIVQNMVELLLSSSAGNETDSKNEQQLSCELCAENPSKVWCPTCVQQLCNKCIALHNTKFTHTVMSVAERTSLACSQHTNETSTLWCTQCKLRLCPLCLPNDERHKQHEDAIEPISKTMQEARTMVEAGLQQLDALQVNFHTLSEDVATVIRQQEESYTKSRETVSEQFRWLTELLQERRETASNELEDHQVIVLSRLQQVDTRVHQQLQRIRCLTTSSRRLLERDNAVQLLETSDSLKVACAEVSENHRELAVCYAPEETQVADSTEDRTAIKQLVENLGKVTRSDGRTLVSPVFKELVISQPTDTVQRFYTGSFIFGYRFRLTQSIRLASVAIQSTYTGAITAILYDENDRERQQSLHGSSDNTFKWTSIPMHETVVMSGYSLLICSNDSEGSIGYQQGTSTFRQIDPNCAVAGVYTVKKHNQNQGQLEICPADRAINMRLTYHV